MAILVYILELPCELGVPSDHTTEVGDGVVTSCLLRFRTVEIRTQLPLAASDLAFGDFQQDGVLGRREKRRRAKRRKEMTEAPYRVARTVAAVYVPVEEISDDNETLGRGIATALEALNLFLISIGVLYDDRLRPLAIDDLPPMIPVMPAFLNEERLEHGPSIVIPLRDPVQTVRTYDDEELDQVHRMLGVVASEDGLSDFYEMIQRAGSARRAGRHREAVVDYGTAGELFITTLLRLVGERRQVDANKLGNLLNGPFKDRAVHLCRLLEAPDDPDEPDCPLFLWWLHCYRQRNGIVHKGARSVGMLSEAARIGMVSMVVDVREAIRADEQIADLASLIRWGTAWTKRARGTIRTLIRCRRGVDQASSRPLVSSPGSTPSPLASFWIVVSRGSRPPRSIRPILVR
jgi:hypothetical protein